LFALLLGPGLVRCADAPASAASSNQPVVVPLALQEVNSSFVNWSVPVSAQSAPFKKEPPAAQGKVIRGVLNFGADAGNALPFLWQPEAGKLFLDLNRNRDFTDDPSGVFLVPGQRGSTATIFPGVRLPFNTAQGHYEVLADLLMENYGAQAACILELRSFWQGKATLHGQDWQVGIVPNLTDGVFSFEKGQLLLRPWEKRLQPAKAYSDNLDLFSFPRQLFVGDHAYRLEALAQTENGAARPELRFAESPVALGELKLTGKYVERLVLQGGPYLVVLDQPGETVKLPTGTYNQPRVLVGQNGVQALSSQAVTAASFRQMVVNGRTPVALAAGGPLTNTVVATRQGQDLRLDYQLVGAGGQQYQLASQNRLTPPEFTVYRGNRQLAAGRFEFG
jgi:hypothetical protein